MNKQNSVMLLATRFQELGDWTVEQQFVLQMGSSYLLAHGIGNPLGKDAVTGFEVPEAGRYRLYVRTKNWTRYWSQGPTPGIFQVKVDGVADGETFYTDCEALADLLHKNQFITKGFPGEAGPDICVYQLIPQTIDD